MPSRTSGSMPCLRARSNSSRAPNAPATPSSAARGQWPRHAMPKTEGMATAAKATRRSMVGDTLLRGDAPGERIAALGIEDGMVELLAAEVGPQHGRDV